MKGHFLVSFLLLQSATLVLAQEPDHVAVASQFRQTMIQYCLPCHNDSMLTANLSVQGLDPADVADRADIWEKVLRKIKSRTMPPAGMPRPDEHIYAEFAGYLETELDTNARVNFHPGPPLFRRLSRTEYVNAIRDIFGVTFEPNDLLPADHTMLGFDNVGEVLTLSPLLAEKYLSAARKVRARVIRDPRMQSDTWTYSLPPGLLQNEWMGEDLPFGSRGGIAVHHDFPVAGEYRLRIRLQRNSRDYIRGLTQPQRMDVWLDGKLLESFRFGGEVKGRSAGLFSSGGQGDVAQEHYERTADEILETRVMAESGTAKISITFPKLTSVPEQPWDPEMSTVDYAQYKGGVPGIASVLIEGPFPGTDKASTVEQIKKIFICTPVNNLDVDCAGKILTTLARQAYRRDPSMHEISGLLDFFRQGARDSGFEQGIGFAIERMLSGPEFLFLAEAVPQKVGAEEVFRISDFELATRLALFLWSSIPDAELLKLAEQGRLSDPQLLREQVERMLADEKSAALVNSFASQWLSLEKINAVTPDAELFPYFDDNLRQAFLQETRLFVEFILKEDRPLMELLTADYGFINERLARHYGISGVYGSHFRKVAFKDNKRGGLLGQGSVLTVTSYANRTAPTIRGKWILENILGAPPPPPPANVPGLLVKDNSGKSLSMRQAMEQHRANPVCASCHKVMDPLGFALEKYDAIGLWREIDAASGAPVDSAGQLPDGTAFDGPMELKQVLIRKRQQDFVLTVIEKLMTYALNREVNHYDAPSMREIFRSTVDDQHRLSALVAAIVASPQFQHRRVSP